MVIFRDGGKSTRAELEVEESRAEMFLRLSVNCCVPGSSHIRRYATLLTREMSIFGVAVIVFRNVRSWIIFLDVRVGVVGNCLWLISSEMVARTGGL